MTTLDMVNLLGVQVKKIVFMILKRSIIWEENWAIALSTLCYTDKVLEVDQAHFWHLKLSFLLED